MSLERRIFKPADLAGMGDRQTAGGVVDTENIKGETSLSSFKSELFAALKPNIPLLLNKVFGSSNHAGLDFKRELELTQSRNPENTVEIPGLKQINFK